MIGIDGVPTGLDAENGGRNTRVWLKNCHGGVQDIERLCLVSCSLVMCECSAAAGTERRRLQLFVGWLVLFDIVLPRAL